MSAATLWITLAAAVIAGAITLARALRRRRGLPKGASIRYTTHARQRMSEREISATQVEAVLAKPARQVPDPGENSVRLERDFDDRILKVWVVAPWPAKSEVVVKSTAWRHLVTLSVAPSVVGRVIGPGGSTIEAIRNAAGARIVVHRDGTVRISASDRTSAETARQRILALTVQPSQSPGRGPYRSRGGGENMAKNSYYGNSGKSGSSSRGVSSARLHQKSGSSNAFGGYTKVNTTDGTFRMRKSG